MPISEIFSPYKEEINITNIVNAAEKFATSRKAQHSEIRDNVGDKPDIFLFENKFIGFVFHKITPKRYSFRHRKIIKTYVIL